MTIQTQLHSPIKFNQLVSRKSNEQKKTDENVFDLLLAPRLCQPTGNALPCFTAMRTSSPTILDAYHSAFLQCVVKNNQRNAQHSNFYSIPLFFFSSNFRFKQRFLGCWRFVCQQCSHHRTFINKSTQWRSSSTYLSNFSIRLLNRSHSQSYSSRTCLLVCY